jgi:hypothetical protein
VQEYFKSSEYQNLVLREVQEIKRAPAQATQDGATPVQPQAKPKRAGDEMYNRVEDLLRNHVKKLAEVSLLGLCYALLPLCFRMKKI